MTTTSPDAAALTAAMISGDAATIQTPAAGSNSNEAKSNLLDIVRALGADRANGDTSLTKLAFLFSGAVREKIMLETDAEAVYTTFAIARNEWTALATNTGTDVLEISKASVSTFRTFGKPGPVAQADLYERVLTVRSMLTKDELYGSAYNTFVHVNREVSKLVEDKANPATPSTLKISDDQLLEWCAKEGKAPRTDAQKLEAAIATIAKLVKSEAFGLDLARLHGELVVYHGHFVQSGKGTGITQLIAARPHDAVNGIAPTIN